MVHVLDRAYDNPLEAEERATLPMVGGLKLHGYQCGQIWGAALAAGAQASEVKGDGPLGEAYALDASKRTIEAYRDVNGEVNCYELTATDKDSSTLKLVTYFLLKGGTVSCLARATRFAPKALVAIDSSLSDTLETPSEGPVSCTAELARRTGMSKQHQVMAAGYAGGLGLSGEACGVLGLAVWVMGMEAQKQDEEVDLWSDSAYNERFERMVETFLKASDYKFECAEIVGRKFDSVADHSKHVCEGGCGGILEAMTEFFEKD